MYDSHWHARFGGRGGPPFGRRGFRRGDFGDFGSFFGGPPPRAERGNVRYLVLDAIAAQPRHGYEIIQHIEERSGGTYRPSPGVIYPTLQMLEELEHARVEERDGKKVYAITAAGKKDLAEHHEDVREFYERSGESSFEDFAEDIGELMKRVKRMFKAIGRSARRGRLTPTTMRKLRVVLDEALAKIEDIVGDDGVD
ncbi:MAG TPA: PadR family transcriptional regulator [Labilithrix sp.]|jgi:DNA-binding PadR family transcriptional regulator